MDKVWDLHFLAEAWLISTRSKDPSTQVGAVIVSPNKPHYLISKGYNGLPAKMQDKELYYLDRDLKYEVIIHGEENALLFAKLSGYTNLEGCCLYTWPFLPCSRCASKIIQVGITRVVSLKNHIVRWDLNIQRSRTSFSEAEVETQEYPKSEAVKFIRERYESLIKVDK